MIKKQTTVIFCLLYILTLPTFSFSAQPINTTAKLKKTPLEHFQLWSERDLSKKELLDVRRDLLNVRREVGKFFGGTYPDHKFDVILTERNVFEKYSGLGVHVAGFFDGKIHLPIPNKKNKTKKLKSILWHEYTHALIWHYSKGRSPLWVHEGFASYLEDQVYSWRRVKVRELLSGKDNLPYSFDRLESVFRSSSIPIQDKQLAYLQSFAVADYLVKRYSRANVRVFLKKLSKGQSVEKALQSTFHVDYEKLDREVKRHIKSI